jgi:K+-sensing histidine kinase KdpD
MLRPPMHHGPQAMPQHPKIPNPALDYSHSNPEFCHLNFLGHMRLPLTSFIQRTGLRTAAEKVSARRIFDAAMGGLICSVAAMAASAVAQGHSWKDSVPLIFTAMLLLIAGLFGARAGIFGTVMAALVFASFLFGPAGSIRVANEAARTNLGWMLLIGIAFSLLFAPPTSGLRR